MDEKRKIIRVVPVLFLLGLLMLVACSTGESPTVESTATDSADVAPTEVPTEVVPTEAEQEIVATPSDQPEEEEAVIETEVYPAPGYPAPTQATGFEPYPSPEQESAPPVKTGLEASDPSTVVLATGKPQLIEFFAFW